MFATRAVKLATINSEKFKLLVNGQRLRLYHKPTNKEAFMQKFEGLSNSTVATDGDPLGSPSV